MEELRPLKGEDDKPPEVMCCFFCMETNCTDYCQSCLASRGLRVYFCSPEHQSYHTTTYREGDTLKSTCCPFYIRYVRGVGRILVSNRVIKPGELIFREDPLMTGPHHETLPICLSCGSSDVNGDYVCPSCCLPLCNEDCYNAKNSLHSRFECKIFSAKARKLIRNFGEPHPLYQCILPLRCLLLQKEENWVKNIINVMMDHLEDRPKDIHWQANQKNIVQYLRESQGLFSLFSPEDINHVIGILDVNAFDLPCNGRGLYPLTAIMSHSCVSNTKYIIRKRDHVVECRATVIIQPGEELTDHYVSPLIGTEERSARLRDGWYFDCNCLRCKDPTELNTFMSSFLCDKCEDGYVSKNEESTWFCSYCSSSTNSQVPYSKTVEDISDKVSKFSSSSYRSIPQLETLLQECISCRLSPSHHLVLTLQRYLIYAYKSDTQKNGLETKLRARILSYCENLLRVADVVTPGLTKERGLTLYELTRLNLMDLETQSQPDIKRLTGVTENLRVVLACLEHEDEDSFPSQIRREAKGKLDQMNEILTLLKLMMKKL